MNRFQILIDNTGERFACTSEQNVLRAMESLGRKGIPVGCRGGGCGVCKVKVLDGEYRTDKMSRACVSVEEEGQGYALACKLFAGADLRIEVVGKMARAIGRGAPEFDWLGSMNPANPRRQNDSTS